MELYVEKLEKEPLYAKLKKRLLDYIEAENLQMLPNEKELMARYGVSRNTLRRAIQELTNEKVLQPIQGIGTIVYPIPEIEANSRILVTFDIEMRPFQQEVFSRLLFMLNCNRLNTSVIMLNKEDVDINRFSEVLKECDGVILDQLCSFSPVILKLIAETGKKQVCMRWVPDLEIPYVAEDVSAGFYNLTRHLIELGHRDIAFIGNEGDKKRLTGIDRAFRENGLDSRQLLRIPAGIGTRADGYWGAEKLLSQSRRITAVLGNSDETALGIQERLLIAGKRIPEDISVTGFDNLRDCDSYPVPLTTCSGDTEQIIHEVIGYLYSSRKSQAKLNRFVEPKLIVRKSTGPAPRQ